MADINDGFEFIYAQLILDPNLVPMSGFEFITSYIDGTVSPSPTILGVSPGRVQTAESATVFATGVGSTQSAYTGRIQGQDDLGSWSDLTPTRWEEVAASPDAYTADRLITDDMEIVDVEHVEIDVVVPAWATPPHFPIRIITDAP